jgi:hypothetical protein
MIEREAWSRQHVQSAVTAVIDTTEAVKSVAQVEPVAQPEPAQPEPQTDGQPVVQGTIASIKLGSFNDFEAAARRAMQSQGTLPQSLQSWMEGAACKIALNNIWLRASEAFDAGCSSITLTREELERLVPERLRGAKEAAS